MRKETYLPLPASILLGDLSDSYDKLQPESDLFHSISLDFRGNVGYKRIVCTIIKYGFPFKYYDMIVYAIHNCHVYVYAPRG